MKSRSKIFFPILLSLAIILCLMPVSAFADGSVAYIDQNGDPRECSDYGLLSKYHGGGMWWVLDQSITLNDRLEIAGEMHLILVNGNTLTARKGISVNEGSQLYIYGQSGNKGKLIANESKKDKCAGIGGDNDHGCGTIVINGGKIVSYGGSDGAGIGGGNEPDNGNVNGRITINGGDVEAYGGKYGAGIGGGDLSDGGIITINGGKVYAKGGQEAAAIGGGDGDGTKYGNGGTITINGGNVTADGFEYVGNYTAAHDDACLGAGIGGGGRSRHHKDHRRQGPGHWTPRRRGYRQRLRCK